MESSATQPTVRKVFWEDPYKTSLFTSVKTVQGDEITLYDTIFYAFSGGQESDAGTIGTHRVLQAEKRGLDILYRLEAGHGLVPGDAVEVEIDWSRRYALMRLHFAAEVVLEMVLRLAPGIEKIGAHISPSKARIDFGWSSNIAELFPRLQEGVSQIVASNEAITSAYSSEVDQRRYWKIDAFAAVPCGGTHLRRTGEIGEIELRRKNVGRGKERIEISLRYNEAAPTHREKAA
ncbi:MAG: alanyl-tRNA editing protein [Burkholderiaceae bacterium]|jgi:Ser-tRNA(Ala) deacylase AlaX